jgi:glutamate--cysteine ligase
MLQELIEKKGDQLLLWLEKQKKVFHHFYSSIDLRENNYKASPVDINLFPSGFNNFALDLLQEGLAETLPPVKKIALLVENFTRNEKYLANVARLKEAVMLTGREVSLFTIENQQIIALEGSALSEVELILLNNDLTQGAPEELFTIPSLPSPLFGWYKRRKSCHFKLYNELVEEMAKDIMFDPWLLTSYSDQGLEVNFREKIGLEALADKADKLLQKIKNKYQEYSIKDQPYLFIKADSGTFGLGIFTITDPEEILTINKKTRHSLATIKGGKLNDSVILQEGIITGMQENNKAAERVLYQIKNHSLGTLLRYNDEKNNKENLNSPGMSIKYLGEKRKLDQIIMALCNITLEKEFLLLSNKSI